MAQVADIALSRGKNIEAVNFVSLYVEAGVLVLRFWKSLPFG